MIEWLNNVEDKLFIVLVSSLTSILVFILGWVIKIAWERNSLTFKLKKEYEFEQKKALKVDIAKHKVSLLNIVEDFNHRLWNFKENIKHDWHKINKKEWEENRKYYTRSFVYRFLVMIHYVLKLERDTISIDTTLADNNDIVFLKYVKSIKEFFSDSQLLKSLEYELNNNENHFFKNDLIGYSKWIIEDKKVMDYDEFKIKTQYNYIELEKVISYFSNINNDRKDRTLNILKCFHIFIIVFLNKFGHDYQKTDEIKLASLIKEYERTIEIKSDFRSFIYKCKLEQEFVNTILALNSTSNYCTSHTHLLNKFYCKIIKLFNLRIP